MKFKIGDKIVWRYENSLMGTRYCSGTIKGLPGKDPLRRYSTAMDTDYHLYLMEEYLKLNHTGETFEDITEKEYQKIINDMSIDVWK